MTISRQDVAPSRASRTGLVLTSLFLLAGCSPQPYVPGYAFYPQPAMLDVLHPTAGGAQQTPLTVYVSILGVRRADAHHHVPHSVAVRMRLENNGPGNVRFDPRTLQLVTGTLRSFDAPQVYPAEVIRLSPGQQKVVNALFPFPPNTSERDFNLNNLRLRWQVEINNGAIPQTAFFERIGLVYATDSQDSGLYWMP